jgi:5'-nucleotidase
MSQDRAEDQQGKGPDKVASPRQPESPPPPNKTNDAPRRKDWWPSLKNNFGAMGVLILVLIGLVAGSLYLTPQLGPSTDAEPAVRLIVIQLNDIYRLDTVRSGKRGGLGRIVTLLRQLKAQNPNVPVIVLHAGDFLAPSLESDVFRGAQMIDAMNFIHEVAPLYVVPGNHEFDYRDTDKNYLTEAVTNSKFPWIASNLERSDALLLPALRERSLEHVLARFGNRKLGIFGLTIDASHRGNDQPYAPISGDYARIATEHIARLEREGADLIVGLTHLNIGDDHELAKLKQSHPRFVWIVGGHEHSVDRAPASPGTSLITKGDSNARTIWKISVVEKGQSLDLREEAIRIDEAIAPDPAYTQTIEAIYRAKLRRERHYLDYEIATVDPAQPNRCYDATEEAVRERESGWGNVLTDTMRTAYQGRPADVAVLNGGSIRIDDFICDRITFEDLERTFAYETPVVFIKIKGRYLREYILSDSDKSKPGDGRFLQVSGVSFQRGSPAQLQILTGTGVAPFDDEKTYVVAVNDYLFDCGDGYTFRQYVTEYVPPGPDLRALTYSALSRQTNPKSPRIARIRDLPSYAVPQSPSAAKWQKLDSNDRQCRK